MRGAGAGAYVAGGAVLLVVCMGVALVGRALDWSPFALVLLGAAAGSLFATGVLLVLYGLEPGDDYQRGYRHGREDAWEEATHALGRDR